jgi:hypothetical protein
MMGEKAQGDDSSDNILIHRLQHHRSIEGQAYEYHHRSM